MKQIGVKIPTNTSEQICNVVSSVYAHMADTRK